MNRVLNLTDAEEASAVVAAPGQSANFLLTKDNTPVYAVVNGFWVDLAKLPKPLPNTLSLQ